MTTESKAEMSIRFISSNPLLVAVSVVTQI